MSAIEKSRKDRLRACERALAEHMEEFVKVGLALKEIRDDHLWDEDGYKSFVDYCKDKWGIGKSRAYQLIDASETRLKLPAPPPADPESPQVVDSVWNENHMRQLNRLGSPTKAKAVAERVVKEVKEKKARGEKVKLGSVVRKHVDEALGTDRKPKPAEQPEFKEVVARWCEEVKGMAAVIEDLRKEDLERFGRTERELTKDLAVAIEGLSRAWQVAVSASRAGREK